jgi:hypothetical protein
LTTDVVASLAFNLLELLGPIRWRQPKASDAIGGDGADARPEKATFVRDLQIAAFGNGGVLGDEVPEW